MHQPRGQPGARPDIVAIGASAGGVEAAHLEMPQSAIRYDGPFDLVGSIDALAAEICRLSGYEPKRTAVSEQIA